MPQDTATEKHEQPFVKERRDWHNRLTALLGSPTNQNVDKLVELIVTTGSLQFMRGYSTATREIGARVEHEMATRIREGLAGE